MRWGAFSCLCVSLNQPDFCYCFLGKGVTNNTHVDMQKHTPGVRNQWQFWPPHRAPIDDIIAGHLVTPPFPCFRKPFSLLQLHQGPFTDTMPIAYVLVIIQFSRLQSWKKYFSCDSDGTINNWPVFDLSAVKYVHLWIEGIWINSPIACLVNLLAWYWWDFY